MRPSRPATACPPAAVAALVATFVLSGCSSGGGPPSSEGNVSGAWCGLQVGTAADCVGDEVIYAELTQTGTAVTGMSCEDYLDDCFPLDNGSVVGDHLTYRYTFAPDHVDADLTLSADGQSLTGTYASTKCSCQVPETLHLLP
jgi:hypothetical protein